MPASTDNQKNFFKAVLAYKKGKLKGASKKIKEASKDMSEEQVLDFVKSPVKKKASSFSYIEYLKGYLSITD